MSRTTTTAKARDATTTAAGTAATSGKPGRDSRRGSSLPAPLRRMVARFAKEIRDEHGLLERHVADRVARMLRTSVVPRRKPGRPTSPEVLKAAELRKQGMPWPKVYGQVIPGYWKLSYPDRFWRSTKLRDAVRAHRRRRAKVADRPRRRRPK